ncbi:MAG: zinc-dependent peptidase, family [candidate division NC10 bacterium]|nr:zinc-dependent peptidase, family [candidate division NC10 bacterium]
MKRILVFFMISAALFLVRYAAASTVLAENFRLPVTEHTLKNGMRLLIVERRESPTFSAYIRFNVGSVNEAPGQTGLAHLLEHMMFKGTTQFGSTDPVREQPLLARIDALHATLQVERRKKRLAGAIPDPGRVAALERELAGLEEEAKRFIVRNELWEIYRRNGGTNLNASTSRDGTQYFISLPKNRLELWALLESDRMRDPVFREFYTERDVVQEERRQRVDTSPRGQLTEAAVGTAFTAVPYRHPVLGWPGDLENLNRPQAQAYFRTYYAPNNALAVLVGDLDPAEVIRVVERYFADLPPQSIPPAPILEEPPQPGERRIRVEFPAEPQVMMLYQAPPLGHADSYPLAVLGALLGDGRSSRLYKRLVEEKRLVTSIAAGPWFLQYAGLFLIQATPRAPHTLEEVEAAVEEEIAVLKMDLASPREMLKVRNQTEVETVEHLASNAGLASRLGSAWALTGNWRSLFSDQEKLTAVTAEEVRDVARRYLIPGHRTVASLVRGGRTAARGAGAGRPLGAHQPWDPN